MPDEPRDEAEFGWLLEPPGPHEAHVSIAIGSEVELSPEARAALETFISSVEESEVSAFAFELASACGDYHICNTYGKCQPVERYPCANYVHCRVADFT